MSRLAGLLARGAVREFGWLSLSNQLNAGLSMLTMVVLARTQSLQSVGQVVFAQAVAAVTLLVIDIRFEDAMQRFHPIIARDHGRGAADRFFWRICRADFVLGAGVIVASLIAVGSGWIPDHGSWVPTYVTLALVAAGAGTALGTLNSGYAVTGSLTVLARISMIAVAVNGVLSIAGALVAGATGFLVGQLVGTLFQVAVTGWGLRSRLRAPRQDTRSVTPPGLVAFLAKSSTASSLAVGSEAGVLAVGGLVGSAQFVALLKVAQAPGRLVAAVFSPLAVQAFPRLAKRAADNDQRGVQKLAWSITLQVGTLALAMLVIATPAMKWLLRMLYGHAFEAVWGAALLLLASACVRSTTAWSKVLPLAIGRPGLRLLVLACESLVLLSAAWLAARTPGPAGVLTFSLVAVALAVALAIFWLLFLRKPISLTLPAEGRGSDTHG